MAGLDENCSGWVCSFSERGRLGWLFQLKKENHSYLERCKIFLTWPYHLFPVTLLISLFFSSHTFFLTLHKLLYLCKSSLIRPCQPSVTFPSCPSSMFWGSEIYFLPPDLSLVQVKSEFDAGEVGCTEVHIQMLPMEQDILDLISLPTTKRKLFLFPTLVKSTVKSLANIPMAKTAEGSSESWWLSQDTLIIWICILNTYMIVWTVLKESGV